MRQREPFESILCRTLTKGFSEQFGTVVSVDSAETADGPLWLMHPLLNACYASDVAVPARHFLRDSFRYTPVKLRFPLQWLLGTFLATGLGLRLTGQPAFRLSVPLPSQELMLIMPGNQRIRVFDFRNMVCRVLLKDGFNAATMEREVTVRTSSSGPFPPVIRHAADYSWLEEPIIEGCSLPRCRPGLDRGALEARAINALNMWLERSTKTIGTSIYLEQLRSVITRDMRRVTLRFPNPVLSLAPEVLEVLMEAAQYVASTPLAISHGDFQAGNIMVDEKADRVYLIDWEHSAERFRYYDHLVYDLHIRFVNGLGLRCRKFLRGESRGPALNGVSFTLHERRAALALVLLEELSWRLNECLSGPYSTMPESLTGFAQEMRTMATGIDAIF